MAYDLSQSLLIGVSSRALFDLEMENRIFENEGVEKFHKYQLEHEDEILKPGAGFYLVKALLKLNRLCDDFRVVEVLVMSKNSPDTGLRVYNSIKEYDLDITRAVFTGGEALTPYLKNFNVDLFLSKSESGVQCSSDAGIASALIYDVPLEFEPDMDTIRIAFDADAVIFSEESEKIYQENGLEAFIDHEGKNAKKPLLEGPFAKLLKTLSFIQSQLSSETPSVRIALVTSRNSPAHERVIRTLRAWNIRIDEAYFLGGVSKDMVLKAFRAHIFFDDQDVHLNPASKVVPSARVPYKRESTLE